MKMASISLLIILVASSISCSRPASWSDATAPEFGQVLGEILKSSANAEGLTDGHSSTWSSAIQNNRDFNTALMERMVS